MWRRWRSRWKRDTAWRHLMTVHLRSMASWDFAGRRTPKCDRHSISSKSVYRLSWTNTSPPQSPDIIFSIRTSALFKEVQTFYSQMITLYHIGHGNNIPAVNLFVKIHPIFIQLSTFTVMGNLEPIPAHLCSPRFDTECTLYTSLAYLLLFI